MGRNNDGNGNSKNVCAAAVKFAKSAQNKGRSKEEVRRAFRGYLEAAGCDKNHISAVIQNQDELFAIKPTSKRRSKQSFMIELSDDFPDRAETILPPTVVTSVTSPGGIIARQ